MRQYTTGQWPATRDIIRDYCSKSAALVAVDCHDHALARGMSILVGSIVGNYKFSLYILKCV
jgi:hypothetical protein